MLEVGARYEILKGQGDKGVNFHQDKSATAAPEQVWFLLIPFGNLEI